MDVFEDAEVKPLVDWPERDRTLGKILELKYSTDEHRVEWQEWFLALPDSVADLSPDQCFSWNWKKLMDLKAAAKGAEATEEQHLSSRPLYEQASYTFEVLTHEG